MQFVEVEAVVLVEGSGLVDAIDVRFRVPAQADDVVAVGGGAGSDLDAVEARRGA